MKRAGRVDKNQKDITRELRELGYSVHVTSSLGGGFADLVVGGHGKNLLVELKTRYRDVLTEDEEKFFKEWKGLVIRAHTVGEIHAAMLVLKEMKSDGLPRNP